MTNFHNLMIFDYVEHVKGDKKIVLGKKLG